MANGNITRRQALQTIGATLAATSLMAAESKTVTSAPKAPAAPPPQPFTLPSLGYGYDALEPMIDARTMEIHHTKHHQAYIDTANRALAEFPVWQKRTGEELLRAGDALPEKLRVPVRNHVGGHLNHSLFWQIIGPKGGQAPKGELATAIDKAFGSYEAFQARFTDAAMKRFGSGWAWLSSAPDGSLVIHSTPNQDSPLMDGYRPILGIDVWEHAYYLKYQNRRLEYVEAFFRCVRWSEVDRLYHEGQKVVASSAG